MQLNGLSHSLAMVEKAPLSIPWLLYPPFLAFPSRSTRCWFLVSMVIVSSETYTKVLVLAPRRCILPGRRSQPPPGRWTRLGELSLVVLNISSDVLLDGAGCKPGGKTCCCCWAGCCWMGGFFLISAVALLGVV